MSKAVAFLAVAILIGVVILSVSIRGQLAEKRRLADEFVAAQQTSVREAAADLAREWRQLDEDGRLVATLASQMSGDRIRARASTPAMYESFRSLATVVRYYRCIAFAPRGKGPSLSAVDPTEKPEMAKWLLDRSLSAGSLVADGGSHFDGPVRAPDGREFLFYTTAVESLGSVVLAAELPL